MPIYIGGGTEYCFVTKPGGLISRVKGGVNSAFYGICLK